MGTIIEELITDFTNGVTDNVRTKVPGIAQMITNFDAFTHAGRLIPYYDKESGDVNASTSKKQAFEIALWTPSTPDTWRLFGLGVVSGTGKASIHMKLLQTGTTEDLGDNLWADPANNESSSSTSFNLFKYYKTTGLIYGAQAGTAIWAFSPSGAAFDDAQRALAYTNIGQGLVHSKDDNLYIPYDNKIARNNAGSWTDAALTIPSSHYITSIAEFGNYLQVASAPLSGVGKSRVYLWDRDSSLATISESIDFGQGNLMWTEELEGYIIGASISHTARNKTRITFRYSSGGNTSKAFKEFIVPTAGGSSGVGLLSIKQKVDNRIYFSMHLTIDGVMRRGVWSVGISSSGGFTISNDSTPFNDVVPNDLDALQGFFIVGDYFFTSYLSAPSTYALGKTNNTESYTGTAILETTIKNAGDSEKKKKLIGFTALFEPLPAAGVVKGYYKKDAETGWTRAFVFGTDNAISKAALNLESDTTAVTVTIASPGVFSQTAHGLIAGQVIKLRTTGALPTGLTAGVEYYVIATGLTADAFQLSATSGGSAINTTGTQNGTHTIDRTVNLTEGKEFKFRIESTGGAVITGLRYKMDVTDKAPY